jgi:hypothetical protein
MSYERNKTIALLYRIFQAEDYQWMNRKQVLICPSYKEIDEMVTDLEYTLIDDKSSNMVESGLLRIEYDRQNKTFEYYLNVTNY